MTERRKPARLILLLGEYLGFSLLCSWVSILFFLWASQVISANYSLKTGEDISFSAEYWLNIICIAAGIVIALFVAVLLLQHKFSYIVQLSRRVEAMEAGNLSQTVPVEGNDELSELAVSINHLAAAWQNQLEETEGLNRQRMETVATLSHDLRTPLTSVMSYLQLIEEGQYQSEEQLKLYASRAYQKAVRIKEMSDGLFDSCVPGTRTEASAETVDGAAWLHRTLEETAQTLRENSFTVEIKDSAESRGFCLQIEPGLMARSVDNLVSNIKKYADAHEPIVWETELDSSAFCLRQSNKILPQQEQKNVESHGLGLKSVRESLAAMGGTLKVHEENGFFTAELWLPIL